MLGASLDRRVFFRLVELTPVADIYSRQQAECRIDIGSRDFFFVRREMGGFIDLGGADYFAIGFFMGNILFGSSCCELLIWAFFTALRGCVFWLFFMVLIFKNFWWMMNFSFDIFGLVAFRDLWFERMWKKNLVSCWNNNNRLFRRDWVFDRLFMFSCVTYEIDQWQLPKK